MMEVCGASCGCGFHLDSGLRCELEKGHRGPHGKGLDRWFNPPIITGNATGQPFGEETDPDEG